MHYSLILRWLLKSTNISERLNPWNRMICKASIYVLYEAQGQGSSLQHQQPPIDRWRWAEAGSHLGTCLGTNSLVDVFLERSKNIMLNAFWAFIEFFTLVFARKPEGAYTYICIYLHYQILKRAFEDFMWYLFLFWHLRTIRTFVSAGYLGSQLAPGSYSISVLVRFDCSDGRQHSICM